MVNEIRAGDLECAYRERGPAGGPTVLLVHGFPDDARTWDPVASALANDGYRTIAPFVRGFGPTRLLPGVPRTGEIAALARDVLALADALGLARFHLVGHDWGARAGYAVAALAPERLLTLTALAVAYGTNVASARLDVHQLRAYWYQWYFATARGEQALQTERAAFCRDLWRTWSPNWAFSDEEFGATAESFDNPDFVAIVLHSYRVRWGFVPGDPAFAADAAILDRTPALHVPTLTVMGRDDGATLPKSGEHREHFFRAGYELQVVDGCGHFVQREKPGDVLALVRGVIDRASR